MKHIFPFYFYYLNPCPKFHLELRLNNILFIFVLNTIYDSRIKDKNIGLMEYLNFKDILGSIDENFNKTKNNKNL